MKTVMMRYVFLTLVLCSSSLGFRRNPSVSLGGNAPRSFQVKDFDHYEEEAHRDYDGDDDDWLEPQQGGFQIPAALPSAEFGNAGMKPNKQGVPDAAIVFPDSVSQQPKTDDSVASKIPTKEDFEREDFKVQLSKIASLDDFLNAYVDPESIPKDDNITTVKLDGVSLDSNDTDATNTTPGLAIAGFPTSFKMFGNVGSEPPPSVRVTGGRSLGAFPNEPVMLQQATCKPEMAVVQLERPTDPDMIYFPTCVRLQRCSGCCESELVQCEAKQVQNLTVKVVVVKYSSSSARMKHIGYKYISVEAHETCDIGCKIKESDCNAWQAYQKDKCRCECKNTDVMDACTGENKLWDPRQCRCICRQQMECSTGSFFDADTCKCIPLTVRTVNTGGPQRRGYGRNENKPDGGQQGHQFMTLPPSFPEIAIREHNYEDGDDMMYPDTDDLVVLHHSVKNRQQQGRNPPTRPSKNKTKKKDQRRQNSRSDNGRNVWFKPGQN